MNPVRPATVRLPTLYGWSPSSSLALPRVIPSALNLYSCMDLLNTLSVPLSVHCMESLTGTGAKESLGSVESNASRSLGGILRYGDCFLHQRLALQYTVV